MTRWAIIWFLTILVSACQSPYLVFPGKALTGELGHAENFDFAKNFTLLTLETHPPKPYSVILRVNVIDSKLYIDAASNRRWHDYIKENKHIRIQLGEVIYLAKASVISDEEIKSRFLSGRTVYLIEPE
ncbi:MAG: hypothetical protein ACI9CE_000150 [Flavobacterium sp.]|jgi:hypothetical protein